MFSIQRTNNSQATYCAMQNSPLKCFHGLGHSNATCFKWRILWSAIFFVSHHTFWKIQHQQTNLDPVESYVPFATKSSLSPSNEDTCVVERWKIIIAVKRESLPSANQTLKKCVDEEKVYKSFFKQQKYTWYLAYYEIKTIIKSKGLIFGWSVGGSCSSRKWCASTI